MVTIYISLNSQDKAKKLAEDLLINRLVASVNIDFDNSVLVIENNKLVEKTNCLLSMPTKSILFTEILNFVSSNYEDNIAIYSLPVTQANESLSQFIRENTKNPTPTL